MFYARDPAVLVTCCCRLQPPMGLSSMLCCSVSAFPTRKWPRSLSAICYSISRSFIPFMLVLFRSVVLPYCFLVVSTCLLRGDERRACDQLRAHPLCCSSMFFLCFLSLTAHLEANDDGGRKRTQLRPTTPGLSRCWSQTIKSISAVHESERTGELGVRCSRLSGGRA